MVFSSNVFIFIFLPLTVGGYYLLGKRFRNSFLLFMSILFFSWSQPEYLWVICYSIILNYFGALLVYKIKKTIVRKAILIMNITMNLGILFYYKYFNFVLDTLNHIVENKFVIKEIILPIGISFFTFQGLSYVIDVYKREVDVQRNPFKVALYILFFPQLIAGPIVRYCDVALQIEKRDFLLGDFSEGIERFIVGLGKKVVLADSMALIVDSIWARGVGQNTVTIAWLGCIAYTLQIYFDFSGYSDMAIGLGKIFGFHFNENFNLPYISKSITEFWRRWHISLSTWFREYVYIPLGGNRKGNVYVNLFIVFLLTGIWHGASWNFIVWGIYHGFFILLERLIQNKDIIFFKMKGINRIYTLFVVSLGWVIFRATTLGEAYRYIKTMFGIGLGETPGVSIWWYLNRWNIAVLIIAVICSTSVPRKIYVKLKQIMNDNIYNVVKKLVLLCVFSFALIRIVSGTYSPFIYFQF